ncbi:hypothetical protein F4810DRAFT_406950 [Camillea tinctor]|nr:hypothetical protein F4810DRAFT_406950 [Camillea tinctor]
MKYSTLFSLAAAVFTARSASCFRLPEGLADGSYVVKYFDDDGANITIYPQDVYMAESPGLFNSTQEKLPDPIHGNFSNSTQTEVPNSKESGIGFEDEEADTPAEAESAHHRIIARCRKNYISPKCDAIDAYKKLMKNCMHNKKPHKPRKGDHHIAILAKKGNAVAYMCHWGNKRLGNECMPDELAQLAYITPCKEATRLRPGGNGGDQFVVAARLDFTGPKRGYGYDLAHSRHICSRHHRSRHHHHHHDDHHDHDE